MESVARMIGEVFEAVRPSTGGALADYIPELGVVDPESFGIAVATIDGFCHEVGDSRRPFTIQSVSKAFTYAMALDAVGKIGVEEKVGLEPSGDAFNEISLDPVSGKPLNPMINAGAIAVSGLIPGDGLEDRFDRILSTFSAFAGGELGFDEDVYRSEARTGHRNRAIAYLLRNGGILGDTVDEDLDLYFRQCALLVTCRDLAVMGATLANDGINPLSGERVVRHENVERVLSVMASSGMYDSSGGWIARVGFPAKSGVGGGIVGVLPGQLAIAVYSPRLDAQGNSVRGLQSFEAFSKRFNLHVFNTPTAAGQVVRRSYRLSESGSSRRWRAVDREYLRRAGTAVSVIELQGDLFFSAVERLSRSLGDHSFARTIVFDVSRVGLVDDATEQILSEVLADLVSGERQVIIIDGKGLFDPAVFHEAADGIHFAEELDLALEEAERQLLIGAGLLQPPGLTPFGSCELVEGLDSEEVKLVEQLVTMRRFSKGATLCHVDDAADEMFVIAEGSLDVVLPMGPGGDRVRIATMSPGVCVGDIAVIDGRERTADVVAVEDTQCYVLTKESLDQLERTVPAVYAKILRNILIINLDRLRRDGQARTRDRV